MDGGKREFIGRQLGEDSDLPQNPKNDLRRVGRRLSKVRRSRALDTSQRSSMEIAPSGQGQMEQRIQALRPMGDKGVWAAMHTHFADDPDMESIMIDGTIVRAHACAAGAPQKCLPNPTDQALGRSKGGFTTKIHVMVDALGNPLDFILTGGQAADVTQAYVFVEDVWANYALMDKAYDADKLIEQLENKGIIPVIPPKSNRKVLREYDKHIYKERNLVECFIGKLKHFRRVFSRFDKWAKNYMHFIRFAAALIWLR
jgi:transposase